jgi:Zn-dependent protease with chaperone function
MIAFFLGPVLLVALLLGRSANRIVTRYDPALAVRLLVRAATVVAAATAVLIYELSGLVVAQSQIVASRGGWSGDVIADKVSLPVALRLTVALAALAMTASAVSESARTWHRSRTMHRYAQGLHVTDGLAVVDDPGAPAYAIPRGRGAVVIDAHLLTQLDARERRAVLAHERSHLQHRHHRHLRYASLAAAVNPLLRPVVGAVALGVERWADEDAARVVGDRRAVAHALAKTGLFRRMSRPGTDPALAMATHAVSMRVHHLMHPSREHPRSPLLILSAVCVIVAASAPTILGEVAHELWEAATAGLARPG